MGITINKAPLNFSIATVPKQTVTVTATKNENNVLKTSEKSPAISKSMHQGMIITPVGSSAFSLVKSAYANSPHVNIVHTSPTLERDFENVALEGLDRQRPDLISLINFVPAYKGLDTISSTAIADLIVIQTNLRLIAEEIIEEIVTKLIEVDGLTAEVKSLQDDFLHRLENARDITRTINTALELFDRLKKSLNIKRFALSRPKNQSTLHLFPRSIKRSLIEDHGFNPDNVPRFSNTKVLMQLIYELYQSTNFYSHGFLNTSTSDRFESSDAVTIHKTSKIDLEKLIKINQGRLFAPTYLRIINGLPEDLDDRIKLITNFVSNETIVSQGLGITARVESIARDFPGRPVVGLVGGSTVPDRPNPFLRVIGVPGDKIYEPVTATGTAASVAHIVQGDNLILPIETKYLVDENEEAEYISGEQHLIKSIYSTPEFDMTNLIDFRSRMGKINKAATAVRMLMSLGTYDIHERVHTDLDPDLITSKSVVGVVQTATAQRLLDGILDRLENAISNDLNTRTVLGIMNFSSGRSTLRNIIFKYFSPVFDSDGVLQLQTSYNTSELGEDDLFDPGTTTFFVFDSGKESLLNQMLDHVYTTGKAQQGGITAGLHTPPSVTQISAASSRESVKTLLEDVASNKLVQEFYSLFNGFREVLAIERNAVDPSTKRTRWRDLTEETLYTVMWELYISIINRMTNITITDQNSNSFTLDGSQTLLNAIPVMIDNIKRQKLETPRFDRTNTVRYRNIVNSMIDVRSKLARERAIIDRTNRLLDDWANDAKDKADKVISFFQQVGTTSAYGKFLQQISEITATGAGVSLFDRQQVVLANKTLDDITRKVQLKTVRKANPPRLYTIPPIVASAFGALPTGGATLSTGLAKPQQFVPTGGGTASGRPVATAASGGGGRLVSSVKSYVFDGTIPSQFMQDALQSMLKSALFRLDDARSKEIKILTVGLPIGFHDHLREKIDLTKLSDDSFTAKETDIVRVQVMKQDLEYDSIIFKPIEYLFELSRFVPATQDPATSADTSEDPNLDDSSSFDQFLANIRTDDYTGGERFGGPVRISKGSGAQKNSNSTGAKIEDEMNSDVYQAILQPGEREEIRRNHIVSYLLEQYIRFVIGIDFRESNFLLESVTVPENVRKSITPQLQTLLNAIDADTDVRAFLNLFTTKTILSDGQAEYNKIITPKRYERIFNVPVYPDEFEIDRTKTESTAAGLEQLKRLQESGVVTAEDLEGQTLLFLRRRNRDNIALERFFVTIATHDDEGFV